MDAHCIPSLFLYVFEIFPKKKLEKNNCYLNGSPSNSNFEALTSSALVFGDGTIEG